MSKDSDPRGLSRILKLSLDAALGKRTPHATVVRKQEKCEVKTGISSVSTSDSISSTRQLAIETNDLICQEDLKSVGRESCTPESLKRSICKSGRGRGRNLIDKSSKFGVLQQNNITFAASKIDENESVSSHIHRALDVSFVGAENAKIIDVSSTAAETDITEDSLENNKQTLVIPEDVFEQPDPVKCQSSPKNTSTTNRIMGLMTVEVTRELSPNSTIDCPAFRGKTIAKEQHIASKSLAPKDLSSRGRKQPAEIKRTVISAAPRVDGKQVADCAGIFRGKKPEQASLANTRNYTKTVSFCQVRCDNPPVVKGVKFTKQTVFDKHDGSCKSNQKSIGMKSSSKHGQDGDSIYDQNNLRTQLCEPRKDRSREAKHTERSAAETKQHKTNDDVSQQETNNEAHQQETNQVGNDTESNQQVGDDTKSDQQVGDNIESHKHVGGDTKSNPVGDTKVSHQEADLSSIVNQPKGDGDSTSEQREIVSQSEQQGIDISLSETNRYLAATPISCVQGVMVNVEHLNSGSRDEQNLQLIQKIAEGLTANAATGSSCQDVVEGFAHDVAMIDLCQGVAEGFTPDVAMNSSCQDVAEVLTTHVAVNSSCQDVAEDLTTHVAVNSSCQDVAEDLTILVAVNSSCQDVAEVKEEYPCIASHDTAKIIHSKDESQIFNLSVATDSPCMPYQVLEASGNFVRCNSSVHTAIDAIYQSFRQETTEDDDKPAELAVPFFDVQKSTEIENLSRTALTCAQEHSNLKSSFDSAEEDSNSLCQERTSTEKEDECVPSVPMGGDKIHFDIVRSSSEEEWRENMSICSKRRSNDFSLSKEPEGIGYGELTAVAEHEENGAVSELNENLTVFTEHEKGDTSPWYGKKKVIVSACRQKEDTSLTACEQKEDTSLTDFEQKEDTSLAIYEQKEETSLSACEQKEEDRKSTYLQNQEVITSSEDRGSMFVNDERLVVKDVGFEAMKYLVNYLESEFIMQQKLSSLESGQMSDTPKCSTDVPIATGSQPDRLIETEFSQNPLQKSSANRCSPRTMSSQVVVDQPRQSHLMTPYTPHQHNSSDEDSRDASTCPGLASSLYSSEGQKESSFTPIFHPKELRLPVETLCSSEALDRMFAFLKTSCADIQQHTAQYSKNHLLDATITVSLTHSPLSDCVPKFPQKPPMVPYPGWMPPNPACWNWWPWPQEYSPNIGTPINNAPPHCQFYPAVMYPVPPKADDMFQSSAEALPSPPADRDRQRPICGRMPPAYHYPRMYSWWNSANVVKREHGDTYFRPVDPLQDRQDYWSAEMTTSHSVVNTKVETSNMPRWQTTQAQAEHGIGHEDQQAPTDHLTESVSPSSLCENNNPLDDLSAEGVATISTLSEEIGRKDIDRHTRFRRNSLSSALPNKHLVNNWNVRTRPETPSVFGNQTVNVSPREASPSACSDSWFPRRDRTSFGKGNTSHPTVRSSWYEPVAHTHHSQARRCSAPYNMAQPWTNHQRSQQNQYQVSTRLAQNWRRRSEPVTTTISATGESLSTGEEEHMESGAGWFSQPNKIYVRDWASLFLARSRNYQYKFIDSHCHIDFLYSRLNIPKETLFSKFQEEHADIFPCNYEGCVAVFCNPSTFNADDPKDHVLKTVLAEDGIWLAAGCHPKHAAEFTDAHLRGLRHVLQQPKVVALGEIGLDYSGSFGQHSERQKLVFRQQLQLAMELKLPIIIHCRDADDDCLEILTQTVPRDYKIHAHCFTRDMNVAMRWISSFPNLFLGLTPLITYKSALDAINTATFIPLDRLLLETDAPYFVPGGVRQWDLKYSHPGFALFTAERVAELKGLPVDEVLKACRENTNKMYGI